jgi:hypothetical protein
MASPPHSMPSVRGGARTDPLHHARGDCAGVGGVCPLCQVRYVSQLLQALALPRQACVRVFVSLDPWKAPWTPMLESVAAFA